MNNWHWQPKAAKRQGDARALHTCTPDHIGPVAFAQGHEPSKIPSTDLSEIDFEIQSEKRHVENMNNSIVRVTIEREKIREETKETFQDWINEYEQKKQKKQMKRAARAARRDRRNNATNSLGTFTDLFNVNK